MNLLYNSIIATSMLLMSVQALGQEHATRAEAESTVKRMVQAIKADGKDAVVKEVNRGAQSKYSNKDMYLTIETVEGVTLANNIAPRMVGKNVLELRDPEGKYFIKERNNALKAQSSFWTEMKWPNRVTSKNDLRNLYAERVGEVIVSAGVVIP